jgi:hypothetical protein
VYLMLKNEGKFVWLLLVVIFQCHVSYADFIPHSGFSCPADQNVCIPEDEIVKVHKKFQPKNKYEQGSFGSCYFFSALYLLQYLVNESNHGNSRMLEVVDAMSKGCHQKLMAGGLSYMVLQNWRNHPQRGISLQDGYSIDYDKLITAHKDFQGILYSFEGFEKIARDLFPQFESTLANMRDIFALEFQNPDSDTFLLRAIGSVRNQSQYKLSAQSIPPYIIYVEESFYYHGDQKTQKTRAEVRKEIRTLFSRKPNYPINFNLKPSEVKFSENHAVTLTGVRKVCCADADNEIIPESCVDEWKIANSYGDASDKSGWFIADKDGGLIDSFLKNELNYVYINPCAPAEGDLARFFDPLSSRGFDLVNFERA